MESGQLMNKIALDLCALGSGNAPSIIGGVFEAIGTSFALDRVYFYHFSEDGTFMRLQYMWLGEGVSTQRIAMMDEIAYEFPWLIRKLKQAEVIALNNLDEIPFLAVTEKEMLDAENVQSCLMIPMQTQTGVVGFFGLETVFKKHQWTEEEISAIGDIGRLVFGKMQDYLKIELINKALYEQSLLLDYSNVQLFALKNPTVYAGVNEAHAAFFGKKKEDLQNQNLFDIFPPETANQLCQENLALFELKTCSSKEFWIRNGMGQERLIHVKSQPKTDTLGNVEYLICTAEDVTDQRKVQNDLVKAKKAAEAANIAKSEFLANMSHEIRTPMNGIFGFMQLLSSTDLTDEQKNFVEQINLSTDALLRIINDILDFTKIEAGRVVMEEINFNVRSTVESAVMLAAPAAYQKGLEIYTLIKPHVPREVLGDPGRLRQVLNNLINNAVKFTHAGEITILVDVVNQDDRRSQLRFEICDTGIGISQENLGKLFSRFTQADASTTRKFGGTGLGLAICKRLVELMNGGISVTSRLGKGSKFVFTCTFKKSMAANLSAPTEISKLQGTRILIMDPQPSGRKVLQTYLEEAGCIVTESESCQSAGQLIQSHDQEETSFDAVIVSMPQSTDDICMISGKIAEIHMKKVPKLIMLISFSHKGEAEHARKMGYSAFLTRPIKRDELLESLALAIFEPNRKADRIKPEIITKHSIHEMQFDQKPRLLLVEDNEINQKFILLLLKRHNLIFDIAVNGIEAVNACLVKDYDLILMDCQMPEMDGYLATAKIRQNEAGRRHTPIIALTANALEGDREKCIEAGMDDYITKPLQKDQLLAIFSKYIRMS